MSRKKQGSLSRQMAQRVRQFTKNNNTRRNALRACKSFDGWRREQGLSAAQVRADPAKAAQGWIDHCANRGLAPGTVKQYAAGICKGLGFGMQAVSYSRPVPTRSRSRGNSVDANLARAKESNAPVVQFQQVVGIRRAELESLRGGDTGIDESGHFCVIVRRGKGGKVQWQRVAPEHVAFVRNVMESVPPDAPVFGRGIDHDLDLHGIRAEHARSEYVRYATIASTPEGCAQLERELWARYTDPDHGCKAYTIACHRLEKAQRDGDSVRIEMYERQKTRLEKRFAREMRPGVYKLRGENRLYAAEHGRPLEYNRLALCAVSVFALAHWRNEVSAKYYLL